MFQDVILNQQSLRTTALITAIICFVVSQAPEMKWPRMSSNKEDDKQNLKND